MITAETEEPVRFGNEADGGDGSGEISAKTWEGNDAAGFLYADLRIVDGAWVLPALGGLTMVVVVRLAAS